MLGNFRNNKTCAPEKKWKYSGKLSLPNISILHPHSLMLRISIKIYNRSWWPFSLLRQWLSPPLCTYGQPFPRGFTKTTPLLGSQEGQKPWHCRWLLTHVRASLSGGRPWLMALCSLLDNTNSMGHWLLSISIMDQSQFGLFDKEESYLHRHELLMDHSMYLATMGWEKQKIISHSEVWNEGIRRQVCRYIKHLKIFKCCKNKITLLQGFSGVFRFLNPSDLRGSWDSKSPLSCPQSHICFTKILV